MSGLPGTLWVNRGRWNWRVKLPGSDTRKNYPVKMPGKDVAMPASKPKSVAESVAWRMWEKASKVPTAKKGSSPTAEELCQGYCQHALVYYRDRQGNQTREAANISWALRFYRSEIGARRVDELTHADLVEVRRKMVERNGTRTSCNKRVSIWNRMMAWALDEGMIGAALKAELSQVSPLKAFRSNARDAEPVTAAPHWAVKAVVEYLPRSLADMARVQELSGMRPGEVCGLDWARIEKRRGVWLFRPVTHKNEHRGLPRVIVLGPMAQRVLGRYAKRKGPIFSPRLAMSERFEEKRRERKTKVQPSQIDRSRPGATRKPGVVWTPTAYARAVLAACQIAIHDGRIAAGDVWAPNQLRHSCGTRIRRWFGINAARAVLGHSWGGSKITDVYSREAAEDEFIRDATEAMTRLG